MVMLVRLRAALRSAAPPLQTAAFHTTRAACARAGGYRASKQAAAKREQQAAPKRDIEETRAADADKPDLEQEWRRLRAKTFPAPREKDPFDYKAKKLLQERLRKRRLGLLPDDDDEDDEKFIAEQRARFQEAQEMQRARQEKELKHREWKEKKKQFEEQLRERPGSVEPRRLARRPVSAKEKVFTRQASAPNEVVEREFLDPDDPSNPRGLDVAVIGRPNAGKSSILNRLIDITVSAVSPKYNTTRDRVLGILTEGETQLAFYDTPGIIKPKEVHQYVRELATTAAETVESVDMSMLVVDAVKRIDEDSMEALETFVTTAAQVSSPIMLVLNKVDLVGDRERVNLKHRVHDISQMIEDLYKTHYKKDKHADLKLAPTQFTGDNAIQVSALKGTGMAQLKSTLLDLAVERDWEFHSSYKSDKSDLDIVTEIIREKLFRRYNKEIPYMIEQENVGWTTFRDRSIRIDQDLFVPAPRVRKMIVGQNGDTIRSVGIAAREEIERLLGCPVHLYLNVRVRN